MSIRSFTSSTMNSTASPKTVSISWSAGDVIVVGGICETDNSTAMGTPTATGLTFSSVAVSDASTGSECEVRAWKAVAAGSGSAVTVSVTGSSLKWGIVCWVVIGGDVVDSFANNTESATSLTVGASADVLYLCGDWNATNNNPSPTTGSGTATEQLDARDASSHKWYVADWVGTSAGTFSFGMSTYTSMKVAQIGIEVSAAAGGDTNAPAGHSSATGAANAPTTSVKPSAGHSSATGAANAPTTSVKPSAGNASATGVANAPSTKVDVNAGHASATGAAHDPTVSTDTGTNAPAGHASATGAAADATVSVQPQHRMPRRRSSRRPVQPRRPVWRTPPLSLWPRLRAMRRRLVPLMTRRCRRARTRTLQPATRRRPVQRTTRPRVSSRLLVMRRRRV
jgi:hypothetical protein